MKKQNLNNAQESLDLFDKVVNAVKARDAAKPAINPFGAAQKGLKDLTAKEFLFGTHNGRNNGIKAGEKIELSAKDMTVVLNTLGLDKGDNIEAKELRMLMSDVSVDRPNYTWFEMLNDWFTSNTKKTIVEKAKDVRGESDHTVVSQVMKKINAAVLAKLPEVVAGVDADNLDELARIQRLTTALMNADKIEANNEHVAQISEMMQRKSDIRALEGSAKISSGSDKFFYKTKSVMDHLFAIKFLGAGRALQELTGNAGTVSFFRQIVNLLKVVAACLTLVLPVVAMQASAKIRAEEKEQATYDAEDRFPRTENITPNYAASGVDLKAAFAAQADSYRAVADAAREAAAKAAVEAEQMALAAGIKALGASHLAAEAGKVAANKLK
ncbi:MAG: hypothetical protein V4490_04720 [Pseudomonadota bacterium]